MRRGVLLLACAFVASSAHGQLVDSDTLRSATILKFTPLALFDLDNTVQIGLEVPMRDPAWSVQQEAGYGHSVFNVWYAERDRHPRRETWRFRSQVRYYFKRRNQNSGYLAGEYLFKKNSEKKVETVGRDCVNPPFGPCAYFENRDVHLGRFVNAFHLKIGGQYLISERVLLDFYVGLGVRQLNVRYLDGTGGGTVLRDRTLFGILTDGPGRTNRPGNYPATGSLSGGIHLGYRLKR